MLKVVKMVFISALSIYCLSIFALYMVQRDLMFSTSTERVLPSEVGMSQVEEVTLQTLDGEKLYSWYGQAKPGMPTILYFHGNGGSVASRSAQYRQFMALGYGIFMLGYPGYGGSEGNPSEKAFIDAARLSYVYLQESKIESQDIIIFGESLGTAVAVQLAAEELAKALVLLAPMSSILEIAENQYPFVPIGMLLKDPFLSINYIDDIHIPLLVFHGSSDQIIPITSGRKLFDSANEPKIFHTIDEAGHNNLFGYSLVDLMHSYLQKIALKVAPA